MALLLIIILPYLYHEHERDCFMQSVVLMAFSSTLNA